MGRPNSFSLLALVVLAAATALITPSCGAEPPAIPRYDYRIVRTLPHDPDAYSQGFLFHDGEFFESTGRQGTSSIRRVEVESGVVQQEKALPVSLFGEGLALHDGLLTQLTWKAGTANVFDLKSFSVVKNHRYEGEGWGLTTAGDELVMSNGSDTLSIRDPKTFEELRKVKVTLNGGPLPDLNELEWVKGELWANVWKHDQIARIDLSTGEVKGIVHLEGIYDYSAIPDQDAVLNGIAYDAENDRVFVTGKLWPHVFEIELVERAQ